MCGQAAKKHHGEQYQQLEGAGLGGGKAGT